MQKFRTPLAKKQGAPGRVRPEAEGGENPLRGGGAWRKQGESLDHRYAYLPGGFIIRSFFVQIVPLPWSPPAPR